MTMFTSDPIFKQTTVLEGKERTYHEHAKVHFINPKIHLELVSRGYTPDDALVMCKDPLTYGEVLDIRRSIDTIPSKLAVHRAKEVYGIALYDLFKIWGDRGFSKTTCCHMLGVNSTLFSTYCIRRGITLPKFDRAVSWRHSSSLDGEGMRKVSLEEGLARMPNPPRRFTLSDTR